MCVLTNTQLNEIMNRTLEFILFFTLMCGTVVLTQSYQNTSKADCEVTGKYDEINMVIKATCTGQIDANKYLAICPKSGGECEEIHLTLGNNSKGEFAIIKDGNTDYLIKKNYTEDDLKRNYTFGHGLDKFPVKLSSVKVTRTTTNATTTTDTTGQQNDTMEPTANTQMVTASTMQDKTAKVEQTTHDATRQQSETTESTVSALIVTVPSMQDTTAGVEQLTHATTGQQYETMEPTANTQMVTASTMQDKTARVKQTTHGWKALHIVFVILGVIGLIIIAAVLDRKCNQGRVINLLTYRIAAVIDWLRKKVAAVIDWFRKKCTRRNHGCNTDDMGLSTVHQKYEESGKEEEKESIHSQNKKDEKNMNSFTKVILDEPGYQDIRSNRAPEYHTPNMSISQSTKNNAPATTGQQYETMEPTANTQMVTASTMQDKTARVKQTTHVSRAEAECDNREPYEGDMDMPSSPGNSTKPY